MVVEIRFPAGTFSLSGKRSSCAAQVERRGLANSFSFNASDKIPAHLEREEPRRRQARGPKTQCADTEPRVSNRYFFNARLAISSKKPPNSSIDTPE